MRLRQGVRRAQKRVVFPPGRKLIIVARFSLAKPKGNEIAKSGPPVTLHCAAALNFHFAAEFGKPDQLPSQIVLFVGSQREKVMEIRRIDQSPSTILVVDRDPLMLTAMASVLDMQGHRALLARTEEVAMKAIESSELDLIVLAIDDLKSGCEFAERLRSLEKTRDVPVIFLVPQLTAEWSSRLHAHGGVYSLLQPIDPHALIDLVERAVWMPHIAKAKIGAPAAHLSRAKDWVRL